MTAALLPYILGSQHLCRLGPTLIEPLSHDELQLQLNQELSEILNSEHKIY